MLPLLNAIAQQVVFPLHIGDRWQYNQSNCTLASAKITRDTLMSNGQSYAIIDSIPKYSWPLDFRYLRQAGNVVYHYNSTSQAEELLYRFDASPGDTLLRVPAANDTFVVVFHFQITVSYLGVQRRQWAFGIYPTYIVDGGQARTITDSLGLTEVSEANGGSTLRGAMINGVKYGDVTSVFPPKSLPVRAMLHQNFPNPFNPRTTITFDLVSTTHASLEVCDLLGRRIQLLLDDRLAVGQHSVQFQPTGFASGVYLYRLKTDAMTATKKLVFMK
jgi:hypothetical protein